MSVGSSNVIRRLQRRSRAREMVESLIERPEASKGTTISTIGQAARAGWRFEETCKDCGTVSERSGETLARRLGRGTPLKMAVLPCKSCKSTKISVLPKFGS